MDTLNSFILSGTLCCSYLFGLGLLVFVGYIIFWGLFYRLSYVHTNGERDVLNFTRLQIANRARKLFGKRTIWPIPYLDEYYEQHGPDAYAYSSTPLQYRLEVQSISNADMLYGEVSDALKHCPISVEKKLSFEQQTSQVPNNITRALWKISRLERLFKSVGNRSKQAIQSQSEIKSMRTQLIKEINHSLDILTAIPVSLLRVELAHGDLEVDRLFAELNESNKRLRDLSSTYTEARDARSA